MCTVQYANLNYQYCTKLNYDQLTNCNKKTNSKYDQLTNSNKTNSKQIWFSFAALHGLVKRVSFHYILMKMRK